MTVTRRDTLAELPNDLFDLMPNAPSKTKSAPAGNAGKAAKPRRPCFTYRLTDATIRPEIFDIAGSLRVPVDDIARAFVEVGLRAAAWNQIPFDQVPIHTRMTLYPTGKETWLVADEPMNCTPQPMQRGKRRKLSEAERAERQQKLNAFRVSYRWPPHIDQALDELTAKVFGSPNLPRNEGRKGWVLTILLRYGLALYKVARLPLVPQVATGRLTLYPEV